MSSRVYIGRLPSRATERDVEDFFRGYGKIRDVVLKSGFGFIEFGDYRDARDAVEELNGRDLCGERVIVELSRRAPRESDRRTYDSSSRSFPKTNDRYGPPVQTRYRLIVENLSTRCSWQDLKDLMRTVGDVTYADAHKTQPNAAIVCFSNRSDVRRAVDKLQGYDINGRRIRLIENCDNRDGRRTSSPQSRSRSPLSRSRSRSRSPRRRSRSARSRNSTRSPSSDH